MSTGSPKRDTGTPPDTAGEAQPNPTHFRTVCRWAFYGLLIAGVAVVAHVWYWGSHIDPQTYGASELLSAGPVSQLIAWDNGYTAAQTSRLTDLPADQLWKVVPSWSDPISAS